MLLQKKILMQQLSERKYSILQLISKSDRTLTEDKKCQLKKFPNCQFKCLNVKGASSHWIMTGNLFTPTDTKSIGLIQSIYTHIINHWLAVMICVIRYCRQEDTEQSIGFLAITRRCMLSLLRKTNALNTSLQLLETFSHTNTHAHIHARTLIHKLHIKERYWWDCFDECLPPLLENRVDLFLRMVQLNPTKGRKLPKSIKKLKKYSSLIKIKLITFIHNTNTQS